MATDRRVVYYSKPFLEVIYYFKYNFKSDEPVMLVTGEYGSGKTTFCRRLVKVLESKKDIFLLYISTPNLDYVQILRKIAQALELPVHNGDDVQEMIFHYYQTQDDVHKFYVLIDDANELELSTLMKLRYLIDFNQDGHYPFRLILFAHVSLLETLKRPELVPFNQRIRRRTKLEPLSLEETKKYIQFRLSKSGPDGGPSFTDAAMERIYEITGGNPRSIHSVCDACLILGAMEGEHSIDVMLVWKAKEMAGDSPGFQQREDQALQSIGRGGSGRLKREPKPPVAVLPSLAADLAGPGDEPDVVIQVPRGAFGAGKGRKKNWGFKAFIVLMLVLLALMVAGTLLDMRRFLSGLL
ncbi:MAG: ExeA family protein [Syntrophobacteraceae bacterium]